MSVRRALSLSGGRSSAYLLRRELDENGGRLPEGTALVFANTGKERPETLDFVERIGREWNVPIAWLEYHYREGAKGGRADPRHVHRVVDHVSASRAGEPFECLVKRSRRLSSPLRRTCTSDLKVETIARYLRRELGWETWREILGIRYDEPRRWTKILYEQCRVELPLVEARVTRADVERYWRSAPFDLALPYGDGWSNCDLCFLKGTAKLQALIEREPDRAAWWERLERHAERHISPRLRDPRMARFNPDWTYRELRERAAAQLPLAIEGGGEPLPCYCAD